MHVFLTVSNVMIVLGGLESLMLYYLVEQDVSTVRDFVRHLGCGAKRAQGRESGAAATPARGNPRRLAFGDGGAAAQVHPGAPAEIDESVVQRGDGVVTKKEMENIHRVDRVCAVVFPFTYTIVCAVVLNPG